MIALYCFALAVSFVILFKCADLLVDGSCGIAGVLNIPKMVVGIVLVSLATTAPEFGVSVTAAFLGHLEISLGNAVGSVICDDGIALALAAAVAPLPILVNCRILKIAGSFLLGIDVLAYLLARNGTLGRAEGALFVGLLVFYFVMLFRIRPLRNSLGGEVPAEYCPADSEGGIPRRVLLKKPVLLFLAGISGVALASWLINWAAVRIAEHFSLSKTIIGLTVIAIGTSLPEISTCISAARKGEGELAVGNIIGADVLNILWIIGISSLVRPIQVELKVINFSFPYMILIVTVMLVSMRLGCRLGKVKGLILFSLYLVYLAVMLILFV